MSQSSSNFTRRFVQSTDVTPETNPWTVIEWMCHPRLVAADKLLLVRAYMEPGRCHPFHKHPNREEIIYVIEGQAEQWVGSEHRLLKAGEMAHIPMNTVHGTYNPHPHRLVFLAILSPSDAPGPDPVDVSTEAPWSTLRAGFPACT